MIMKKEMKRTKRLGRKSIFSPQQEHSKRRNPMFKESLPENIINEISNLSNTSLLFLLEHIYNLIMKSERDIYLNNNDDYANGYEKRGLGTPVGKMNLSVARTRNSIFRPQILPDKYQRDTDEKINLIKSLLTTNYNPNDIAKILKNIGLSYSVNDMKKITSELLDDFKKWNSRPIPQDLIAVYIDGYQAPINYDNNVIKATTFTVIGIDFKGKKDIYGIYTYKGKENKEFWLNVFNDLNNRGLKRFVFIITDDFKGLNEPIEQLFPNSKRQLCIVHLIRNAKRNLSKEHYDLFKKTIDSIKKASNIKEGINMFDKLLDELEPHYKSYINYLRKNTQYYLNFLLFPEELRFIFCTTNIVESFNSILDKIRCQKGGFFQSENILHVNIYIRYLNLYKKWKNGYPKLIPQLYYLRQIFVNIFGELPYEN